MVQYFRSVITNSEKQLTWPLVGQAELGRHLANALTSGTLPRALLFCGPRALGKATGAMWLVSADLCQGSGVRPCGVCTSCLQVAERRHQDVQIIDPPADETIGIETIRAVLNEYQVVSWGQAKRWLVILDADRLTEAAGNLLLKFLESLPPHLRVICTSTEPERLLPTVRSRLTQYYWHTVNNTEYKLTATERRQSQAQLDRAAGRPGWYFAAAQRPDFQHQDLMAAQAIVDQFVAGRAEKIAGPTSERRAATNDQVQQEELVLRDLLLVQHGSTTRLLWPGLHQPAMYGSRLIALAEKFLDRHELSSNVQPRILYDDLHLA